MMSEISNSETDKKIIKLTQRQEFGSEFVVLARRWRQVLDENLAQMGLSDATWSPLFHLSREEKGISQKELAARVGLNGSSLVRLIDILVSKKLVLRQTDTKDRRINHVILTPEGHEAINNFYQIIFEVDSMMLEGVSDEEISIMFNIFEKINTRIKSIKTNK